MMDLASNEELTIEQQKKNIMSNIKSLQRELIKASFRQSSAPEAYAQLLEDINTEREKIKQLNQ